MGDALEAVPMEWVLPLHSVLSIATIPVVRGLRLKKLFDCCRFANTSISAIYNTIPPQCHLKEKANLLD